MNGSSVEFILSDLYRICGNTNFTSFMKLYLRNSAFRFQVALRLRKSGGYKLLGNILWFFNRRRQFIDIHPETEIGYGLYIGHAGPVVVHPSAVLGNNVNLSQYVTIGTNHGKAATIGDNVYIGPNVCIVEDVCIGDGVTIGAGSVVTKDIPNNATAVGNYAKVINYANPSRYIKFPYNYKRKD